MKSVRNLVLGLCVVFVAGCYEEPSSTSSTAHPCLRSAALSTKRIDRSSSMMRAVRRTSPLERGAGRHIRGQRLCLPAVRSRREDRASHYFPLSIACASRAIARARRLSRARSARDCSDAEHTPETQALLRTCSRHSESPHAVGIGIGIALDPFTRCTAARFRYRFRPRTVCGA